MIAESCREGGWHGQGRTSVTFIALNCFERAPGGVRLGSCLLCLCPPACPRGLRCPWLRTGRGPAWGERSHVNVAP